MTNRMQTHKKTPDEYHLAFIVGWVGAFLELFDVGQRVLYRRFTNGLL